MKICVVSRIAAVVAVLLSFTFLTTSCKSREERVISQLESLCKAAEKGNLDADDVDALQEKYDKVLDNARECDFTDEQVKEVARLETRYTKAITKNAIKRAGNAVEGFFEGLTKDN